MTAPASPTILQIAKQADAHNQEALAVIRNDADAEKVLCAWTKIITDCADRPLKKGEKWEVALEELWKDTIFDWWKLADTAGIPYRPLIAALAKLKHNRLIFPDGTVSDNAMRLVRVKVAQDIRRVVPK